MKPFKLTALLCGFLLSSAAIAQASLFDELGGKEGIEKIVQALTPILLADARIKHQFKDTNMELLERQLSSQFCQLSGGPCRYGGEDMKTVHKGMNITQAQFNALAEDLQQAMTAQGVASSVQNKLIAKLAPMHKEIITK